MSDYNWKWGTVNVSSVQRNLFPDWGSTAGVEQRSPSMHWGDTWAGEAFVRRFQSWICKHDQEKTERSAATGVELVASSEAVSCLRCYGNLLTTLRLLVSLHGDASQMWKRRWYHLVTHTVIYSSVYFCGAPIVKLHGQKLTAKIII